MIKFLDTNKTLKSAESSLKKELAKFGIHFKDLGEEFIFDEFGEIILTHCFIDLNVVIRFTEPSFFNDYNGVLFYHKTYFSEETKSFQSGLGEDFDMEILEVVYELISHYNTTLYQFFE